MTSAVELPAYEGLTDVDPAHYRLEGEMARGGMGRIVVARDRRLDRIVALKLLRDDSATLRGRFEREVRITARLQHPAIVPVYEAGRLGDEPFYAMKLVSGRAFDQVMDAEVELAGRLALLPSVIAIAEALAFAHDRGIVHRDVKPQNVLIGRFGETVLIDWGLAKDLTETAGAGEALEAAAVGQLPAPASGAGTPAAPIETARGRARASAPGGSSGGGSGGGSGPGGGSGGGSGSGGGASLTLAGDVMGTPAYMPPEQARGAEVDERADVYALGAVLYHLLAGMPPYVGGASWDVVEEVQLRPPRPLEELAAGAPADLLAIVHKAMARDPAGRYPTAKELAEDLRRFQAGQLVGVHSYTPWELLRRFLRRHRAAVAVALLALFLLLGLGALGMARIAGEKAEALAQRNEARLQRAEALEAGERAAAASARAQSTLLEFVEEQGRQELLAGRTGRAAVYLAEAYRGGRDSPGLRLLLAAAMRPLDAQAWIHTGSSDEDIRHVVASADGGRVAFGLVDESVVVLDGRSGKLVFHQSDATYAAIGLDLSSDGGRLVTGGPDGEVWLWDTADGALLATWPGDGAAVLSVVFSPDAARVAASTTDGVTRVRDARSGALLATLRAPHPVRVGRFADGDRRLLVVPAWEFIEPRERARARATLWDVAGARALFTLAPGEAGRLGLDAAGRRLLHARGDLVEVHEVATRRVLRRWHERADVREIGVSPDGERVVTTDLDGAVAVRDTATGRLRARLGGSGEVAPVYVADFLGDGALWATHADDVVRLWDADAAVEIAAFEAPWRDPQVLVAGGRMVVVAGTIAVAWDVRVASTLRAAVGGDRDAGAPEVVALDASGTRALALAGDELRLYDAHEASVLARAPAPARARRASPEGAPTFQLSADGRRVLVSGAGGALAVLDDTLAPLPRLAGAPTGPARFSPDGARLLAVSAGVLGLWDVASGAQLVGFAGEGTVPGDIASVAFDESGGRAVVASAQGGLRVLDLGRGAEVLAIVAGGIPSQPAFSPDGLRVLAVVNGQVRVWDAQSGAVAYTIAQPLVYDAAWSPDGQWIAAVGGDRAARVWSARTGALIAELDGHGGDVLAVAFDPRADAARVVTTADDGRVRLFEAPTGKLLAVRDARGPARAPRVAADGAHVTVLVGGVALTWALGEEVRRALDVAARVGARGRWRLTSGRLFARPLER